MPFTKWIVSPSSEDEHEVLEMPALQMDPRALSLTAHRPSSVTDMLQSARVMIKEQQYGHIVFYQFKLPN